MMREALFCARIRDTLVELLSNQFNPNPFTMLEDEKQLIEKASGGDPVAFGLLYDHYLPKIYRFVLLKVGQREEAEDLTHQAFLRAWEHIARYADQGFPFGSWLYRIAKNIIIDHYRSFEKRKRDVDLEDVMEQLIDTESSIMDKTLDVKFDMELLMKAMERLKDVEQDVIIMRFVEDLPHEEVAEHIGKSVGATKLIQHRALKNLKVVLANNANWKSE